MRTFPDLFSLRFLLFGFLLFGFLLPLCAVGSAEKSFALEPDAVASPQTVVSTPLWKEEKLTLELVATAIANAEKEAEKFGKETTEGSPEGRLRALWKKRLELLQELQSELARVREIEQLVKSLPTLGKELDEQEKKDSQEKPPSIPDKPDIAAFEQIKADLASQTEALNRLEEENKNRQRLVQELPQRLLELGKHRQEVEERAKKLEQLAANANADEKRLLPLQIGNDKLEGRLLRESMNRWQAENDLELSHAPVRQRGVTLASRRHERLEKQLALYQEALKKSQTVALADSKRELAEKSEALESAETPPQRFLAQWEHRIAETRNILADLGVFGTDLSGRISKQEKVLQSEWDELKNLKVIAAQTEVSGTTAEILKNSYLRVRQIRSELEKAEDTLLQGRLATLQKHRVELESQQLFMRENWSRDFDLAAVGLNEREWTAFRQKSEKLYTERNRLSQDLKRLVLDLIAQGQKLKLLPIERAKVLAEMERLVLSRVLWIQDLTPLDGGALRQLLSEIGGVNRSNSLWNWWRTLLSVKMMQDILERLKSVDVALYGGGLFILLPILLLLVRRKIRRYIRSTNKNLRSQPDGGHPHRALPLVAWLVDALLTPIYFLLTAKAIGTIALPHSLGPVLGALLFHGALFMFLWVLSRTFLSKNGLGMTLFGMPKDRVDQLHHATFVALMAYLACLLPWRIFSAEPFHFEILPRLGFLLFEIGVSFAIFLLIRPASPMIRWLLGGDARSDGKPRIWETYWPVISRGTVVVMVVVPVMDASGYHFGALYLAQNGLFSLGTLLFLFAAERTGSRLIRRILRGQTQHAGSAPGEPVGENTMQVILHMRRFFRLLLILLGGYLIARYWGINESAVSSLNEITLYDVTTQDGKIAFVTVADLIGIGVILLLTAWVVHRLPGLFALTLFSLFDFDHGLRYAVVTIVRYVVIVLGFVWAFSLLKMDLSKVGWVVAAMSVGLGFGLQEIVANFVSGLILLIERPIRVGDMVSIGTGVYGHVTQVNIRSTTVLTRDRLEVLVPNRDLISKEVTNWTLADPVIRERIPIGIAYGSDVDLARQTLLRIAAEEPEVLEDPAPRALFMIHGASSLDFELRIFMRDPVRRRQVIDKLNSAINREFARLGIQIPFPQQDVHLVSANPIPVVPSRGDEAFERRMERALMSGLRRRRPAKIRKRRKGGAIL